MHLVRFFPHRSSNVDELVERSMIDGKGGGIPCVVDPSLKTRKFVSVEAREGSSDEACDQEFPARAPSRCVLNGLAHNDQKDVR